MVGTVEIEHYFVLDSYEEAVSVKRLSIQRMVINLDNNWFAIQNHDQAAIRLTEIIDGFIQNDCFSTTLSTSLNRLRGLWMFFCCYRPDIENCRRIETTQSSFLRLVSKRSECKFSVSNVLMWCYRIHEHDMTKGLIWLTELFHI